MSETKDQILVNHFVIENTIRLHRDKVKFIFNHYIPEMTTRSLIDYLRTKGINYDKSLREYGRKEKGIFIGLKIIKDVSTDENEDTEEDIDTSEATNTYRFTSEAIGYKGKQLSLNTINTWNSRLISLEKRNINYFNYNSIIKAIQIESDNINTRVTSLTAVLNALYQMSPDKPDYLPKLIELKKNWKQEIDTTRCDNTLSSKEARVWVSWYEFITTYKNLTNLELKLILGLYVLHPPRRLLDYSEMYFILDPSFNTNTYSPEDKSKNYCINFTHFIFNRYKTSKTYGAQIISIRKPLSLLLTQYIEAYEISSNTKLLTSSIPDTLNKIKPNLTINTLRKSYLTYFNTTQPTENQRIAVAKLMAHSETEAARYKKILRDEEPHNFF